MPGHWSSTLVLCMLLAINTWSSPSTQVTHAAMIVSGDPQWIQWDNATKTARLKIVAGFDDTNEFFNFNGYNQGNLTITVPVGARVMVSFINKSEVPHSVVFTPISDVTLDGSLPLAFPGASTPDPEVGEADVKAPRVFTFVADHVGHFAFASGIPGYARGGMWDRFDVAAVQGCTQQTHAGILPSTPNSGGGEVPSNTSSTLGAVEGVVLDATTGKPIRHAVVIVGWSTIKRVGETDATGRYRINNIKPVSLVDAYGFAEGYLYYHGHPISLKAGTVTVYSFRMPRQTFPAALLPTLTGAKLSASVAGPGDTVTFETHITPGQQGPLSAENFALNSMLSHSVLLEHMGGSVYRGSWRIPPGTRPGTYQFWFIATMENCLENRHFTRLTLTVE